MQRPRSAPSHESWFFHVNPTKGIAKNTFGEFISERHRTAVLMRHLKELPLSFDFRFISETDKQWIDSVAFRPIDLDADVVELPELPIKQTLP